MRPVIVAASVEPSVWREDLDRWVSEMHIRTLGNTIIAVGVLIFIGSIFADGIGFGGSDGYGPGQITGLIFGPIISFIGLNVKSHADQDENSHS